jgi:hypothetical protein
MNIKRAATALVLAILIALLVYPEARAGENLPEYATYDVCLTGVDHRFNTETDPTLKGFAPDKSAVVNAQPHWHFRYYLADLGMSFDELQDRVIGQCLRADFFRVDGDDGQTHHYATFPYGQGQTPRFLHIIPIEKAGETQGEATEYLNPSMDQETQRREGLAGNGQTNTEQGQERGKE